MISEDDIPFDVHPLDRPPVDLTTPWRTFEIIAGICTGSGLACLAAYYLLS